MMYLRVSHVRGAWKDGLVCAGRLLQREEPAQEAIPAWFRLCSVDCQLVWYHPFSAYGTLLCLLQASAILFLFLSLPCSLGRGVQVVYPRRVPCREEPVQDRVPTWSHLSAAVCQLHSCRLFNVTILFRSRPAVTVLLPCSDFAMRACVEHRLTCPGRVPQRGGAIPVLCSSTVSAFRRRRVVWLLVLTVAADILRHCPCNEEGPAQPYVSAWCHLFATVEPLTFLTSQAETASPEKSAAPMRRQSSTVFQVGFISPLSSG